MTFWAVGASIVGAGVGLYSSGKAADKQEQAAANSDTASLTAQRESIAFQQKQADQARADNEPWRAAGVNALNQLAAAGNFTGADLQNEPGYKFGLDQGMKGLTNSAAARGGLLSGAALKAASQYNQDYAGTKYDAAFGRDAINKNRLATLAGVGQTAASNSASSSMQLGGNVGSTINSTGNALAQNAQGVGNVRASSYLAQGNALTGAINQGVSAWKNSSSSYSPVMEGATNQTNAFNYYGPGYSP
jgi:hypothetical protein